MKAGAITRRSAVRAGLILACAPGAALAAVPAAPTPVEVGYALEGHVPAREVKRLLSERPAAVGLAVPGMPVGSPGMDGAFYGGRRDSFDVLLLAKDGTSKVYQRYEGKKS